MSNKGYKIPGDNFQGGGGGQGDISDSLNDAELGNPNIRSNEILDSFNEEKGTTNMAVSTSALRLKPGQTLEDYDRSKETSTKSSQVDGEVVQSGQMLAPMNNGITGGSIDFEGDVRGYINTSTILLIAKEIETDGDNVRKALLNGDSPAQISVNTVNYDEPSDVTTIVVNNPDVLDLKNGVADGELYDKLRYIPIFVSIKVDSSGVPEDADLVDVHGRDALNLAGENTHNIEPFNEVVGRPNSFSIDMSDNGQYGLAHYHDTVGATTYRFMYTVDGGRSWKNLAFTDSGQSDQTNERAGNFHIVNPEQVKVANNGRAFVVYERLTAASQLWGAYVDLSLPSPVMRKTPNLKTADNSLVKGTGPGSGIDPDYGEGLLIDGAALANYGHAAIDREDCSFFAGFWQRTDNGNDGHSIFTWDAADESPKPYGFLNHANLAFPAEPSRAVNGQVHLTRISGTGANHIVHYVWRDGATALRAAYFNQSDLNVNYYIGELANGQIINTSASAVAKKVNSTYNYILVDDNVSPDDQLLYVADHAAFDFTQNIINLRSGLLKDDFIGWKAASPVNSYKISKSSIAVNPSDPNHVMCALNKQDAGRGRAILAEIPDVTVDLGVDDTQLIHNIAESVNNAASQEEIGQTFTPSRSMPLRTVGILGQASSVAFAQGLVSGTISMRVEATTAGVPNGTVLGTSKNSLDLSKMGLNGTFTPQYHYFNFDSIPLTIGVQYAFIVEGNYPTGADNYVIRNNNVSVYAGGTMVSWNGATWVISGTKDVVFITSDVWITDVGNTLYDALRGTNGHNWEVQVQNTPQGDAVVCWRDQVYNATNPRAFSGYPYARTLKWGNGSTQSAHKPIRQIGYDADSFDEHLVFNVSNENKIGSAVNVETGVRDNGWAWEKSLGLDIVGGGGAVQIFDEDFQLGEARLFNGSGDHVSYDNEVMCNIGDNQKFAMEAEVISADNVGEHTIVSKGNSASLGWYFRTSSGRVQFATSGGGTAEAFANETLVLGQYYRLRAIGDGDKFRLFFKTLLGPWTEFTYAVQTTGGYIGGANTNTLNVGRFASTGTLWWKGVIGYVKVAIGNDSFAYEGFKDQSSISQIKMSGNVVVGKKFDGTTTDDNTLYYRAAFMNASQRPALVDSKDQRLIFEKSFGATGQNMNLKATLKRINNENQSSVQGMIFRYSK